MTDVFFQDYLDLLHAPGKRGRSVAFFDLDGTLIAGYSIIGLSMEVVKHGARQGQLLQSRQLLIDTMKQKRGAGGQYHRLVRRLARAMEGMPEQRLEQLGEDAYRNNLAKRLYREAIELLEAHRARGDHLVMVTAASRYQAEPIARALGIDEICCTRLAVENGAFTGQIVAPLCYGEGKTMAARRVAREQRVALKRCWFYTDSSADLPLLRKVGNPVPTNPSPRLAETAAEQGWPVLHFKSRGRPGAEQVLRTMATGQALASAATMAKLGSRMGLPALGDANRITRLLGDVGAAAAGLDFEIEGLQHLHQTQPAIYVFNHQSLLDALVLAHLLRDNIVAMCKQEMAEKPVIGPLLRQVDTIFVDRTDKDQSAVLKRAQDVLAGGRSLVIAPEGTRSALGQIQPFKHGAFYLSRKTGAPIVPLVLHNAKDALPKGGLFVRPATIRVTVLPAIAPGSDGSIRESCRRLEDRYCELLRHSERAALPRARSA